MGPSPVDRGRPGSKHHLIVDAHGLPLAVSLTGEPQRRHPTDPAGRRGPTDPRPARPAPPPTLQRALNHAVERQNLALFTPTGQARELAAVTLRQVAEAIADGDAARAAAILEQIQLGVTSASG